MHTHYVGFVMSRLILRTMLDCYRLVLYSNAILCELMKCWIKCCEFPKLLNVIHVYPFKMVGLVPGIEMKNALTKLILFFI